MMAIIIQSQGTRKFPPMKLVTTFPMRMPSTMPTRPPAWQIMMASVRNCQSTLLRVAPKAFVIPISRVRSVTETNIMFIRPMAAPSRVIRPMATAASLNLVVSSRIMETKLSLLKSSKSLGWAAFKPRIFLNNPMVAASACSISAEFSMLTTTL